jgi:predicted cupin superfamily sugar epimerase
MVHRLVEHYGMTRLPVEGTWFASTWRSAGDLDGGAPVGTAMIGLFCAAGTAAGTGDDDHAASRSSFHRLTHDEVWHAYAGDPIRLVLLHPDGSDQEVLLGADVLAGQQVQHVVPAGTWQAGELVEGGRWALFGCTMAPGFTGTCFEGGTTSVLLATHPRRAADIERLAVPDGHAVSMPDGFAAS